VAWIAEENGRMAGFAIADWIREGGETTAYLQTLEVVPGQRRCGAGAGLLDRIEDSARAAGARILWLHVAADNAPAIGLYETHGYLCEGREENYYGPELAALIYSKFLVSVPA
jgi:ribosomal-protein-alanine N-acetyltransferase